MSAERVREVVAFLEASSWAERPTPLRVGDLAFEDFAALLEGPGDERQLIVVLDADGPDPVRPVRALVRGLERTRSTRPVTLVAVASADNEPPRAELARQCRTVVVPVGASLDVALRSLVPLDLPDPLAPVGPVDAALAEALGERAGDPVCRDLLAAGENSPGAVEAALHARLDAALDPLGLAPDPDAEEDPT